MFRMTNLERNVQKVFSFKAQTTQSILVHFVWQVLWDCKTASVEV